MFGTLRDQEADGRHPDMTVPPEDGERRLVPLRPGGLTELGPCTGRWGWRSTGGSARRCSPRLG